jgi:peptide/nickel transport system substrate-binding protein
MAKRREIPSLLLGLTLGLTTALAVPAAGHAQDLEGGSLRVAILLDVSNFDPQSFLAVNFPLIKNFYDSLIEYSPEGEPIPSLASAWEIADDNGSVTLTLRHDVTFQSGEPMTAEAVATTLAKAADPERAATSMPPWPRSGIGPPTATTRSPSTSTLPSRTSRSPISCSSSR